MVAGESRIRRDEWAVECGETMHMLRCVLQHPISDAGIGDGVDWESLKTAPSKREDQWIVGLQDLLVPSVTLDTDLNESESVFRGIDASDKDRHLGTETDRKSVV